jgi:acyl dehydratase
VREGRAHVTRTMIQAAAAQTINRQILHAGHEVARHYGRQVVQFSLALPAHAKDEAAN